MSHDDLTSHLTGALPDYYPSSKDTNNYKLLKPVGDQLEKHDEDIETVDLATAVQTIGTQDLTVGAGETDVVPEGERWIYRDVLIGGTLRVDGTLVADTVTVNGELNVTEDGNVDTDGQYRREILTQLNQFGKLVSAPPRENESVEHYRARLVAEFSSLTGKGTIRALLETAAEMLTTDPEAISFNEPFQGEHGAVEIGLPSNDLDEHELSDTEVVEILDRLLLPAGYRLHGFRKGTFTYISPDDYEVSNFDPDKGYDGLDENGDPKGNGGTYAGVID